MTIFHEKVSVLNGFCSNPHQRAERLNRYLTPFAALLLLLVFSSTSHAQVRTTEPPPEQMLLAVEALTDGGIVVRLPSKSRQLEALTRLLDDDDLRSNRRRRVEERRDALLEERDFFNRLIIDRFDSLYQVGPVFFVYDSLAISAIPNGPFLNSDLQADPAITGPQGAFLLLRKGPLQGYARQEGFILKDQYGNELEEPFPSVIGFNNLHHLNLANIDNPRHGEIKKYEDAIVRLNGRLSRVLEDFAE